MKNKVRSCRVLWTRARSAETTPSLLNWSIRISVNVSPLKKRAKLDEKVVKPRTQSTSRIASASTRILRVTSVCSVKMKTSLMRPRTPSSTTRKPLSALSYPSAFMKKCVTSKNNLTWISQSLGRTHVKTNLLLRPRRSVRIRRSETEMRTSYPLLRSATWMISSNRRSRPKWIVSWMRASRRNVHRPFPHRVSPHQKVTFRRTELCPMMQPFVRTWL